MRNESNDSVGETFVGEIIVREMIVVGMNATRTQ